MISLALFTIQTITAGFIFYCAFRTWRNMGKHARNIEAVERKHKETYALIISYLLQKHKIMVTDDTEIYGIKYGDIKARENEIREALESWAQTEYTDII